MEAAHEDQNVQPGLVPARSSKPSLKRQISGFFTHNLNLSNMNASVEAKDKAEKAPPSSRKRKHSEAVEPTYTSP